ncbi:MAG: hypothetical protein GX585_05925 [Clostridiales bacterium]|nr:hypothetical protein [Clostridiales bacterium]
MNQMVNNWTYGEVSPKFGGRFDLPVYQQGCKTLENFLPMKQGGITRRPPLVHLADTESSRLVGFTLSSGASYILQFTATKLTIWKEEETGFNKLTFVVGDATLNYLTSPYDGTQLWQFQYAQYYDRMYFAHRSVQQYCLYLTGSTFEFSAFAITVDAGKNFGQSSNNYPGVVAICQNRLWFASTNTQPYTMWASRPYEDTGSHADFTTVDEATSEVEVLKDSSDWPVDTEGNYDFSDPDALVETITETEEVITARCAMELELASGRNDKISWIAPLNNVIVGTESSEWMLPFDIDPTKQSASMQSSYGCMAIQPVVLNNGLFYIQNGNRLREYSISSEGVGNFDHSFTADHILSSGVVQMVALRNPQPMVVMLLTNKELAVFTYDGMYQIQAWSRWTTEGDFISIAVKESSGAERLVAVVKRGALYTLEEFDFDETDVFYDRYDDESELTTDNLDYDSVMVSNRFDFMSDNGSSIGRSKKVKEIWVRCISSGKVEAGVDGYLETSITDVGSTDHRIFVSGGARKELSVEVRSVGSDPLTLLAMAYDVEVN